MMIFFGCTEKVVETKIKELQKRKESAGKMLDVERKSKEILLQAKAFQTYNTVESQVLWTHYQVKSLSMMNKDAMAAKWKGVLNSQKDAPSGIKWSAVDEINLLNSPHSPLLWLTQHTGGISRP